MKPKLTRRELALAGGLGVAGGVAAGLAPQAAASPAAPGPQHDLKVLGELLSIEQVLEYAYRRVLRSWSFESSTRGALQLILAHESEHAAVLRQHAVALGQLSPRAQGSGTSVSAVAGMLNEARTARDALRVLTKVESLAEAGYFNAVGAFQSSDLALTAAQILSSEAQHWTLLLNALTEGHLPQIVPDAFVRGVASAD